MASLLLPIIYLAFISLGMPDSLIGAAWPAMHTQLQVPTGYAGIITMIIAANTIVSSLASNRLTTRFGAGKVTAVSVLTTAVALGGFTTAPAFWVLCLWAVPYGLGAGAVDAALNNYMALHYGSRQMNWMHCFWGVGAVISPNVMSFALTHQWGWQGGYGIIAVLQGGVTLVLLASLPLWVKSQATGKPVGEARVAVWHLPGLPQGLLTFLLYCSLESTAGIWAATFLVSARGISIGTAASWSAMFYLGMTVGRFLAGILAGGLSDRALTWIGTAVMVAGIGLLLVPLLPQSGLWLPLLLIGLGCAPIYPTIIHETPSNYGAANSQAVIGLEMATAYVGSTLAPPLFGWLSERAGVGTYPLYLLVFASAMIAGMLWRNRRLGK